MHFRPYIKLKSKVATFIYKRLVDFKPALKFSRFGLNLILYAFSKVGLASISLFNFGNLVLIPLIVLLRYFNCFDSSDGIF